MWIKICGNTNLEDCQRATDLGANALGFVFAPGKRTVTPAQVAAITPHLPNAIEKIGVFTSGTFQDILATAQLAGLTGVQLHSAFALPLLTQLRAALGRHPNRRTIIQVLPWFTDIQTPEAIQAQQQTFAAQAEAITQNNTADAMLIDSRTQTATGGTGQTFDWLTAKPILARLTQPTILAGGLTPANVAEAIQTLHPWGIDVASGVELTTGHKDPQKLATFLQNARKASP